MKKKRETVTFARFSVGTETSTEYKGAKLSVFVMYSLPLRPQDKRLTPEHCVRTMIRYCALDFSRTGIYYKNSEEAFAAARQHGYLQDYFTSPQLRKQRKASVGKDRGLMTCRFCDHPVFNWFNHPYHWSCKFEAEKVA